MYRKGNEFKIWLGTFDLDKEIEYAVHSIAKCSFLEW